MGELWDWLVGQPPMLLLIVGALVVGWTSQLVTTICWHLYLRWRMRELPGPKNWPFIGVALQIRNIHPDDMYVWFANLCKQFKEGLVLTYLGVQPIIHIRRPEFMEVILPDTKNIKKSAIYDVIKPWLGFGLLTSSGKYWAKQRKLLTPAFHFSILEGFSEIMSDKAEIMCQCIEERLRDDPKQAVNIFELAVSCTLDTFIETAMGVREDVQRKPDNEYFKALKKFAELSTERSFKPWLSADLVYYLTRQGFRSNSCVKTMHEFTDNVIYEKKLFRQSMEQVGGPMTDVDEFGNRKRKAFLDLLLDIREANMPLRPRVVRNEVDTFMFAGHDTTAAAISWCLFALGNNPEVQAKVHEELRQVFGDEDKPATTRQLTQLKYLERVMKESLRYYPSVPVVGRLLEYDVNFGKYFVPKGSTVFIQIMQMHRDPEVWENPEKFDPDRFLPENCEKRHPYSYVPFSAGPRNCIGQKFAMLEFKTVLTSVLRKWQVKSVLKTNEMRYISHFLLKPYNEQMELHFKPIKLCN